MTNVGQGTFGKVKLAKHNESGIEYAIKILDKSDIKDNALTVNVRREIAIMKALNHKNIVNLREVLTSRTKLYIVMDLVRGGELFEMIENRGELDEVLARKYFQQLIDGIDYCHHRGVCHRDLKPENLLVDENGVMKITDFGVSSMKDGSDLLFTACGTPYYCAPEIINGAEEGYSGVKVDAWSCGIILYLLLTGMLPFQHDDMTRLYELINACSVTYPSWMSAGAKDLISKLLVKNPDRRYALEQVKEHPWFRVDYETGDSLGGGEEPARGSASGGSDSGRSKGSSRSRKHFNPSMNSADLPPGSWSRDAPERNGSGSGSGSSRRQRQGSSGAPPPPPPPKNLAPEYKDKNMDIFVRDALPGKPTRKIDEVVRRLEEIDIDCVDDIQCVAETVQTPAKLTQWLEVESKMPSVTAMRITKMFFP